MHWMLYFSGCYDGLFVFVLLLLLDFLLLELTSKLRERQANYRNDNL
jgi:hypothetical protein